MAFWILLGLGGRTEWDGSGRVRKQDHVHDVRMAPQMLEGVVYRRTPVWMCACEGVVFGLTGSGFTSFSSYSCYHILVTLEGIWDKPLSYVVCGNWILNGLIRFPLRPA